MVQSSRRFTNAASLGALFVLMLAIAVIGPAGASQQGIQAVEGLPMMLPDGRLAIFGAAGDRVVVLKVASVGAERAPRIDLQEGDVVVALQGADAPDVAAFKRVLAGTATGAALRLRLSRGDDEHDVTFAKPSSSFLVPREAVTGTREAAEEGGWVSTPGAESERKAGQGPEPSALAGTVRGMLAEAVDAGGPGMTLAVMYRGEVAVTAARGLASLETSTPLEPTTVLPVASVSKQLTAFAIATLATRGEISLDDDIRRFLPELSGLEEAISVRQLLSHTSGLKDYTGLLSLTGWEFGDRLTADELVTLVSRQRELHFRPGSEHRYSNTNYALLPVIVERITGVSFEEWMQGEVFAPLGMSTTSFPARPGEIIPTSANLYRPVDDGFERAHGGHGLAGPGGMMSTAVDLLRWARELTTGEVGGRAVIELMRRPAVLEDGTEVGYGLGLGVGEFRGVPRLAHSGSGPGSASVLHVYPEDDLAVAVLSNHGEAEVFELAERIAELCLGNRLGEEAGGTGGFPPGAFMITDEHFRGEWAPEGVPLDAETVAAVAGRYVLEDDRELMLEADGATLLLKLRHDIPGVPLVHLGQGRFLFPPAGWELSVDRTARPAQTIVVHLTEGAIFRGDPRDVRGFRSDVREPTAAERANYVGRYASAELGVIYRILEQDGTLHLEHPRLGRLPLTHHSGDNFGVTGRQLTRVSFLRDDPDDPSSAIAGLTAEAHAWGATARFDRLDR